MSAGSLGWYARRLRRMSPGEVARRTLDETRRRAWARRQVRPGSEQPPPANLRLDRRFGPALPATARDEVDERAAAALVDAADRVLAGTWTVFGVSRTDSSYPDWFRDPVTGLRAPQSPYAFTVQHRDEAETGNVKQLWELSRHHHLTVLAAAWWLTGDERYAQTVADQLRSWWRANPFLSGVHWTNGIEVGIRLVAWVWIRRLLDDWAKVGDLFEDDPDALRQIRWHQEYLAAFPSHGSSANNHAVAEAAGRFVAACAFPWYEESPRWRASAATLLERQLAANTFPSGLNRELATDYHRLVLELGLVAAVEADAHGVPLSDHTWQLLGRALDAGVALLDSAGGAPRQGDGDEGRALVVDDPEDPPWGVVLGAGGEVLDPMPWWPRIVPGVEGVLLGELSRRTVPRRRRERPDRFDDAGQVLLRTPPASGPEIWCRCDGGPHGFLSIAAHAHADALAIEVRHDGVDVLADPGTYCYHGEPDWRRFFRSTAGHNTLEVAGVDSSEPGGPFLWIRHARTETLQCRVGDGPLQTWTAEHHGYERLPARATHRRTVTLDGEQRCLTVVDTLRTRSAVPVRLLWHLGPDVSVELDGALARLSWPAREAGETGDRIQGATLTLPAGMEWTAHRGEDDPVLGWYSPGFGRRVPATSLVGEATVLSASRWVTTLAFA